LNDALRREEIRLRDLQEQATRLKSELRAPAISNGKR
jgi:hypothetical protein